MRRTIALALAFLMLLTPFMVSAQAIEVPLAPPGYQPPTKDEWQAAGLDPIEYDIAVRYEVTLEEWKKMDDSRSTHKTAGWACIGVGILIPAIEATIHFGGDVPLEPSPEREFFIMGAALAFASILTGIVVLASTPGPEDFKAAWRKKAGALSLVPSPGGIGVGFTF
jgi:hypothetical protein